MQDDSALATQSAHPPATQNSIVLAVAEQAIDLIGRPECAAQWDESSCLDGYTVGALAAHLGRALTTAVGYLVATPSSVAIDGDAPTAAEYFSLALAEHDPIDSEFHRGIRRRGIEAAAAGQPSVVAGLRAALAELDGELVGSRVGARPVEVVGGLVMRFGDYLDTRLVELCIHVDDLASSLGIDRPDLAPGAWDRVADVVVEVARRRTGPAALALALCRTERTERPRSF